MKNPDLTGAGDLLSLSIFTIKLITLKHFLTLKLNFMTKKLTHFVSLLFKFKRT